MTLIIATMLAALVASLARPFTVTSQQGALWIEPDDDSSLRTRLHLRGANWAGFQVQSH